MLSTETAGVLQTAIAGDIFGERRQKCTRIHHDVVFGLRIGEMRRECEEEMSTDEMLKEMWFENK